MSHVRTQIRDRVAVTLSGLTTTGARAFKSRIYPMDSAAMPGICVYVKSEKAIEERDILLVKEVDVVIDAYVSGVTWDTKTDTIQAEVETALYADRNATTDKYLNGLALSLEYSQADSQYVGDAAVPYGVLRMIYKVQYAITRGAPQTAV
jgi:hypothetical protein